MIIGFDGSRAFQKVRTGTENYSFQLLKNLAELDQTNKYIVYLRQSIGELPNFPENFQFKIINFPRLWTQIGLARKTFQDKLDVLFVPAHTLPILRRPGLKTVITVHDLGSEYLSSMHQLKQRAYLGLMQKFQLKTATKLIAVSKATKEDLIKRLKIDPKKVNVVYEGFDRNLFKQVKNDILVNSLIHYNLKPKNYFLFVGTVQPRKNLERLIQAFAVYLKDDRRWKMEASTLKMENKSSTFKLVIAGSKGWLNDEIYELPKKLGIEERVKFLGYIPDEKLPALYSGAAAFVFPSLFEGFGLPILEAQACGCPVLTSYVSSMPEVAGKGAIYVDPYNVDDIVEGMDKLKATGFRQQVIEKGLKNVKRFSWEKCAEETLVVLEKTV